MGIANKVSKEVYGWGSLAIIIVIMSVVLLKFKDISGVTAALNTTIDTFVTAISEPQNWVVIVIIALIGFGVLAYFRKNKSM